jgi:glycosyltransferase involved in cell wall biosynthesis
LATKNFEKPLIALCAIVKNEEFFLPAMLGSVQDLVDEIVVVDTGSCDKTIEIARSFEARIETFTWNHDFATARNFSMGLTNADWILVLDADEQINFEEHAFIRALVCKEKCAYYLNRYHYSSTPTNIYAAAVEEDKTCAFEGARSFHVTQDIRLFARDHRVYFTGTVHESVEDSIREGSVYPIHFSTARIEHLGPLGNAEIRDQKSRLYLSLAQKKLDTDRNDWRNWFQVGAELQANLRFEEAICFYTESLKLNETLLTVWQQLGCCQIAVGEYLDAISSLQRALNLDNNSFATWNALGVAFMEMNRLREAQISLDTAMKLHPGSMVVKRNLQRVRELQVGKE